MMLRLFLACVWACLSLPALAQNWKTFYQRADSLSQRHQFKEACALFERAVPLAEQEFGKQSAPYLNTRNGLGRALLYVGEYSKTGKFLLENVELAKAHNPKGSIYARALYNLGTFYLPTYHGNNPRKAETYLKESMILRKTFGRSERSEYAASVDNLAVAYKFFEKYTDAEILYKEALPIYKEMFGEMHLEYAQALSNLGTVYDIMLQYSKAEALHKEALALKEKIVGKQHNEYIKTLQTLGNFYRNIQNYTSSYEHYKEALQLKKGILAKDSSEREQKSYAVAIESFVTPCILVGDYYTAQKLMEESLPLKKKLFTEKSLEFVASLHLQGILYWYMGEYDTAEKWLRNTVNLARTLPKVELNAHIRYLSDLASIRIFKNDVQGAIKAQEEMLGILQDKLNLSIKNKILYNSVLSDLSHSYHKIGYYHIAQKHLEESINAQANMFGKDGAEYFLKVKKLADICKSAGKYAKADSLYQSAIKPLSQLGEGDICLEIAGARGDMADIQQDTQKALELLEGNKKIENDFWLYKSAFLGEKERLTKFKRETRYYFARYMAFLMKHQDIIPNVSEKLYDLQIFQKSILLHNGQKMKRNIMEGKDSTSIKDFEKWKIASYSLAKYLETEQAELTKNSIKADSVQQYVQKLTESLAGKSSDFAKLVEPHKITWRDIQKRLKKGEAAIEIVKLNPFGVAAIFTDSSHTEKAPNFPQYPRYDLTDSLQYIFLIIKPNEEKPEMVTLTKGIELEQKWYELYQEKLVGKKPDSISYLKLWQPVFAKLKGVEKVYFSADGIYHQINIEILQNPKNGRYVADEIKIYRLTSTTDLLSLPAEKTNNAQNEAVFVGSPVYEMDKADFQKMEKIKQSFVRSNNQPILDRLGDFNYHPTDSLQIEMSALSALFPANAFRKTIYSNQDANEITLKKIKKPTVLHMATEAFFMVNIDKKDPVLHSGMLLAGVKNYYTSFAKNSTLEDGILTAQEIENLDLDKTDLVVLSACETGLGEAQANEGVHGVQRAFKVAGAKTILMSLWRTKHAINQKFLALFYRYWLKKRDAREAFEQAREKIRKQYPHPFYWGSFVLIGE